MSRARRALLGVCLIVLPLPATSLTSDAPLTPGKVDYKIDYRQNFDAGPAGADYQLRPQVFVTVVVVSYLCLP